MTMKELTKLVKEYVECEIIWELNKKYTALNSETGEVVAEYNPKTGKLIIM